MAMIDKKKGFTLIELVVVMAIIGILLAIAVPNVFGWLPKYRLKGAVNQLRQVIALTKSRAIRDNCKAVLQFDSKQDRYLAFVDNGGGVIAQAGNGKLNADEKIFNQGKMPVGIDLYEVAFCGRASRVQFNGRGFPGRFMGHVYLKNDRNDYLGIKVGITGNARLTRSTDGGKHWD